jgi:hypothetical protein
VENFVEITAREPVSRPEQVRSCVLHHDGAWKAVRQRRPAPAAIAVSEFRAFDVTAVARRR